MPPPHILRLNDTANQMFDRERNKVSLASASRPTFSQNWGWCSENCHRDSYRPQQLQEAQVDVLTKYACKYLGRVDHAHPRLEMCTGRKVLYPRIETYILLGDSENTWYQRKV